MSAKRVRMTCTKCNKHVKVRRHQVEHTKKHLFHAKCTAVFPGILTRVR